MNLMYGRLAVEQMPLLTHRRIWRDAVQLHKVQV